MRLKHWLPGDHFGAVESRGDTAWAFRTDGKVQASSIATGKLLWSTVVRSDGGFFSPVTTALTNDLLVFGAGGRVVALRRADGRLAWEYNEPGIESLADYFIATDSSYIAFGARRGQAIVLHAATGLVAWRRWLLPDDDLSFLRSPMFSNGVLTYQRTRNSVDPPEGAPIVFAVDPATGDSLWTLQIDRSKRVDEWGWESSASSNGLAFFAIKNGRIVTVRLATGAVEWVANAPSASPGDTRILVVSAGELVATNIDGFQGLNPSNGQVIWTVRSPIGSPFLRFGISESTIAYCAYGRQLGVIDRRTRRVRTVGTDELKLDGAYALFSAKPEVVGSVVLAPSSQGLIAFDLDR